MSLVAQTDPKPAEETLEELARLTAEDWAIAGLIIMGAIIVGLALRALVVRSLMSRTGRLVTYLVGRLAFGIVFVMGLVYALNQVGVSLGPLLGLLGLLGLALALAFQDVLSNFIAGMMLSVRRPFRVGDEIGTAEFDGIVEDVSLRFVTIRTFDGVRVFIPNATVWEGAIENYTTLGARRSELKVGVGYDSDLDRVKTLLANVLSQLEGVSAEPEPTVYVQEFGDSSIVLSVLFWHAPTVAAELRIRDVVARRVKRELEDANVEIPFPQLVVHSAAGSV